MSESRSKKVPTLLPYCVTGGLFSFGLSLCAMHEGQRTSSSTAVMPIATTLAATTAVAIQPLILSGFPIVNSPMMRGWAAIHIMPANTGLATTPFITALQ